MKLKLGLFLTAVLMLFLSADVYDKSSFLTYVVDTKKQDLKLYWKNEKEERFGSILNLKNLTENKNKVLDFAMNAGMYNKDSAPQGLYIENKKTLSPLDMGTGAGNFYLKPNGVFYLTNNNVPKICKTEDFKDDGKILYATQSGPMLIIDGKIHSEFKEGSANLNIRNGVGILPDGKVVFVLSKKEINFYDFANYFKELGCKNALYLDGFVSRAYVPSKNWTQTDGNFGVLFAVTRKK
ncbi:phosphodiester glycosidase family protein [Flavobacterium artemisiae]|uniref:Phosphodiester glycosidase family protein n=1 Tax=Flavobacterium artemisiae TaxID=2126556 RepID=A0ABW4HMF5_9FLAO